MRYGVRDVRRRRPEERVRAAGPRAGHRAGRARPRPAGPAEPAGRRAAGGEPAARSRRRSPSGSRRSTAAAWCCCARWPPCGWAGRCRRPRRRRCRSRSTKLPDVHRTVRKGTGLAKREGELARPAPPSPRYGPRSATRPRKWPASCGSAATPSGAAGDDPPGHRRARRHGPRLPGRAVRRARPPCAPTSARRSRRWTCRGWPTGATRRSR